MITRTIGLALRLATCSLGAEPALVKAGGFCFRLDPTHFQTAEISSKPRLTMKEIGTDIPYGNAPARVKFTFKPIYAPEQMGSLEIIPLQDPGVPDFAKAYPGLQRIADQLRSRLAAHVWPVPPGHELPDWELLDSGQTIHARLKKLETPWCKGLQFITQYTQEFGTALNNGGLRYKFQGLSSDGAYYIALDVPLSHPMLPKESSQRPPLPRKVAGSAYRAAEQALTRAKEGSFTPPVSVLEALVQSIAAEGK